MRELVVTLQSPKPLVNAMSRHFGEWDAEPELEPDDLAEMQAELAEIAERERSDIEKFYENLFWEPK